MTRKHAHLFRCLAVAAAAWSVVCATPVCAATLEWNPTGEAGLAGYRVYIGQSSRSYATVVDVGNVTSYPLDSLGEGRTFFFAVTAYDAQQVESDFSAEVSYTTPRFNDPPVSVADSYTTGKNSALNVSAALGVLANDYDPEDDPLTAIPVSLPASGTLTLNASGAFVYQPAANFIGQDSFSYSVTDGELMSDAATVTITITNVLPVNHAPVAVNDQYVIEKNTSLFTDDLDGVLVNDSDVDGDALTPSLVSNPTHGQLTLNASGGFLYKPASNYVGLDSFTYRVSDGALVSSVATVALVISNVNHAPVVLADQYATAKNSKLTVTAALGVLANDFDQDGNSLTTILASAPAHGQLTLNASGGFSYTPANNYVGTDSFGYKASDGIITSAVATVTLTITNIPAPNRAPIAVTDQFGTEKNTPLNVSAPGVLANDSDPDTNSITAVIAALPTHGQLNLSSSGGFSYTPATDFVGTDSFTYRAFDGITTSATATVTIKITNGVPVVTNRAPVANAEQYSIAKNSRLDVPAISGVLSNDYDPDGNPIVAVLSAAPLHGELTLDATGSFSYTPAADFSGIDVFSYRASDGALLSTITTVTITVTNTGSNPSTNQAPIAVGEQYGTTKDTLLTVTAAQGVLVNDFDPDGNPIAPVLVSLPAHGAITMYANGGFLYMPNNGFIGTDNFAYRASDGIGVSPVATVTIAISNSVTVATNRTPMASGDIFTTQKNRALFVDAAHGVLANDYDPDGDVVTAAVVSMPAQGTVVLATNGSFVFTPGSDFVGNDSFAYRVSDGKAFSSVVTVVVTVTDSAPGSEITCADCLVELNDLLAAQDVIESISIQSVPITSSNSLDEAVRAYTGVAKSLRARDPVVVEQLSSVGKCLLVVLSNDVVARRGIVASMYPSPWSASASKLVTLLEQVSRDANSRANAVRVLPPALKNLKRIDTFIARSLVVPESLEDRTISFSLTAATGGKFSVAFKNGNFIAEFADGSLKGGSYSFAQTAWDQGNLNLYFTSAPPEVLQLQFRIPRGRVKGPVAKGSFIFVQ